jgi:hypothetical protein
MVLINIGSTEVLGIVLSLYNLALISSTNVLGIVLSLYNSALVSSYGITIGCLLFHRFSGRRLPRSRYTLGKWGATVSELLVESSSSFPFSPSEKIHCSVSHVSAL